MQWSEEVGGGFSTARKTKLVRPVVEDAAFGYESVNVDATRDSDDSLLAWFERMLRTLARVPRDGHWVGHRRLIRATRPCLRCGSIRATAPCWR